MRAELELILEGAVTNHERLNSMHSNPVQEVSLGTCRFVEAQNGWITAWGGDDEMPVETWIFETDGDGARAWPVDGRDIVSDNWEWEAKRLSIMPAKEAICGQDYMAGQICMLPKGHEGSHR